MSGKPLPQKLLHCMHVLMYMLAHGLKYVLVYVLAHRHVRAEVCQKLKLQHGTWARECCPPIWADLAGVDPPSSAPLQGGALRSRFHTTTWLLPQCGQERCVVHGRANVARPFG